MRRVHLPLGPLLASVLTQTRQIPAVMQETTLELVNVCTQKLILNLIS